MSEFTIKINDGGYKKFDLLKIASLGKTAIIINIEDGNNSDILTLLLYKIPKSRIMKYLKFKWFKIKIYLNIIKIK